MPLLGGGVGGAGNPVGGSFTGPAEALELVLDHCYSYSGVQTVDGNLTTMNSFTTGNYMSQISIEVHGNFAQIATSQMQLQVKMNGVVLLHTYWAASLDSPVFDYPTELVIPAYTELEVLLAQSEGSDQDMQTTIVGRIYRQ